MIRAESDVSIDAIEAARRRIGTHVNRTPLVSSTSLSKRLGADIYLKLELFQKTGSFKPRGAFNKALELRLKPGDRVVAASGGNHAQGVAYAARALGLSATVMMPRDTPSNYLDATRGYGAEIVFTADIAEAFERAAEEQYTGAVAIHPFDDPAVIAGQGTIGLEILEDLPEVTDVVASIGGGGLIGGVASAIKARKPAVRFWGVETEGADAMSQALAAGRPVRMPAITSIAKTLGAPEVSARTLHLVRQFVDDVVVVRDGEAVDAMRFLLERAKVLAEPAAASTLAAAERLRDRLGPGSRIVLLLCGGNIGVQDVCRFLSC
jgi:threonine dehydratase